MRQWCDTLERPLAVQSGWQALETHTKKWFKQRADVTQLDLAVLKHVEKSLLSVKALEFVFWI
jgi:hypothetical protein